MIPHLFVGFSTLEELLQLKLSNSLDSNLTAVLSLISVKNLLHALV
jgi:hypothetical protein